jgi:hypothetical protein
MTTSSVGTENPLTRISKLVDPLVFACKFVDRDELSYDQMLEASNSDEKRTLNKLGQSALEVLNFTMNYDHCEEKGSNLNCRILIFNFNSAFTLIKNENVDVKLSDRLQIMVRETVYTFERPFFQVLTY